MEHLSELLTCYSKHMGGDPDEDIGKACDELVKLYDEAWVKQGLGRVHFVAKLKEAASYAGWCDEEERAEQASRGCP